MFKNHFRALKEKARRFVRRQVILRRHRRIANVWKPMIKAYFEGKIERNVLKPKQQLSGKIIWQYWGQQNLDAPLPPVVQHCFDAVDKYKEDYQVIRLNDANISDYLDFPSFVWNENGDYKFSRVFFSDLLRLALLQNYGGVWIDATILLTGPLPKQFSEQDYFVFRRCELQPNKAFWIGPRLTYWGWGPGFKITMLNSIIFAKKGEVMISTMCDLLLHYWKTKKKVVNYFFFHVLYHELVTGKLKDHQCSIVSDTLPHLMVVWIDGHNYMPLNELLKVTTIHKLTYFDEQRLERFEQALKEIAHLQSAH
jgi:hypothetical protein